LFVVVVCFFRVWLQADLAVEFKAAELEAAELEAEAEICQFV
jgi:hypothetical protein